MFFFERFDDFQFNAPLKSDNDQDFILKKVVYFWKCWDFEVILALIWYDLWEIDETIGFAE